MNHLFLISVSFLFAIFCIIIGFVIKLYIDENSSRKNQKLLEGIGLKRKEGASDVTESIVKEKPEDNEDLDVDDNDDDSAGDNVLDNFNDPSLSRNKRIGKKKLAKLQAKAEAKAHRQQEQEEREERKRLEELRSKEEEKKCLEEGQKEKIRLEHQKIEKEEREKRELEEYKRLKESFKLEEEGFEEEFDDSNISLIEEFVQFVKKAKVVQVDELGSRFRMKSEDVVNRLNLFVEERVLTGVFDDRGKFIYISEDELNKVAQFINQRGRISLQELAEYSNQLISLESVAS